MRLGCYLVSSDLNPLYLDFFPVVRRVWLDLVGIPVRLALVSDRLPRALREFADDVILFPPINGVNTAFQAQCLRLLLPAVMNDQNSGEAVLTSDMDMLPMNRQYYTNPIADLADDSFVVFRSNVLMRNSQIAICYNAASPDTWSALMGGIASIDAVRQRLAQWATAHNRYDGRHGGAEWDADQRLLFDSVAHWKQTVGSSRVVLLDDQRAGFRRLDRDDLMRAGELSESQAQDISAHRFTDYHMMRPYGRYRAINRQIAGMVLGDCAPHRVRVRAPFFRAVLHRLRRLARS